MQFYDSSTKTGIVDDILFKTNATVVNYPLADIARQVNIGYAKVASIIIKSDGRMRWDDPNHANLAIGTFDLVTDQEDYSIFLAAPTALQNWLEVNRVDIKDANGNWLQLPAFNEKDINGIAFNEYQKTAGQPNCFAFIGTSIFLKPKPNYDSDEGCQIFFNRTPSYFISTDTTKQPGFVEIFHPILSLYGQLGFYEKTNRGLVAQVLSQIQIMEREIADFYSKRDKFEKPHLSRLQNTYT